MSEIPEGLYYSEKHEWLRVEEGGLASIGITDFAQSSLGDIVYADANPEGTEFEAQESIGAIESVKAAEELYAPVSGTIASINEELKDAPERLNKEPYSAWIVKIRDYDASDLEQLMDAAAYKEYLDSLES